MIFLGVINLIQSEHTCYYFYDVLTAVECGTLTNPTNGQVTYTGRTTFGQTATYSCNRGYNLVGDNTRTCQANGVWSGSIPICQGMLLGHACMFTVHFGTDHLHN